MVHQYGAIALPDFLATVRERLVPAWAAQIAQGRPPALSEQVALEVELAYDGLVHLLYDTTGEAYRAYVARVILPGLLAGTTPADLRVEVGSLAALVHAEIDRVIADRGRRRLLHSQLDYYLGTIYTLWDNAATELPLESLPPPHYPAY